MGKEDNLFNITASIMHSMGGGRHTHTPHDILDIFHPFFNTVLCCITKEITNNIKTFVDNFLLFLIL